MRCSRCGVEVADDDGYCRSCGNSLTQPARNTDQGRYSGNPPPRNCVSCGRSIPWEANICPYCGHDYRIQYAGQNARGGSEIDTGIRIVFYILSVLFWIAGLIIGLVLYTRADPESKHVGKICLILACVSILINIGLAVILYIIVLGFGG